MTASKFDTTLAIALHAAAGELQAEVAEVGPDQVWEADLRRAIRRGLQFQLGPHVRTEHALTPTGAWQGRLGGVDVAVLGNGGVQAAIEVKWCRNAEKLAEAVWDALKLVPFTIDCTDPVPAAYLAYAAPLSAWSLAERLPVELFGDAEHDVAELLTRYAKYWKQWLPRGPNSPRLSEVRSTFRTTPIVTVPINVADGKHWDLRSVRVHASNAKMLFFNEHGLIADEQPAFDEPAPEMRFVDTAEDIQVDQATLPTNRELIRKVSADPPEAEHT